MSGLRQLLSQSPELYTIRISKRFSGSSLPENEKIIIYGAGTVGKNLYEQLKSAGFRILCFADGNKKLVGLKIHGLKIISLKELKNRHFHYPVVIASVIYEREIYHLLKRLGIPRLYPLPYLELRYPAIINFRNYHNLFMSLFRKKSKDRIEKLWTHLQDSESQRILTRIIKFRLAYYHDVLMDSIFSGNIQYFDKEIIKLSDDEILADCGSAPGEIISDFIKLNSGKFRNIFGFEPDKYNYRQLKRDISVLKDDRISLVNAAVSDRDGLSKFYELGSPESGMDKTGTYRSFSSQTSAKTASSVKTVSLDNFFKDSRPPTFIKMDIEGAEADALKGAKNIIARYKPKLAVCIYHKPEDLWEIPLQIHRLNKKYKFYVRHYSHELCETVCYAL